MPEGPEGITWRAMTVDDVEGLVELESALADADHPSVRVTREQILTSMGLSHFDLEHDTIVGVEPDGRLVAEGRAVLAVDDETVLRVRLGGGVHPDLRRRGIGGRVLDWQIDAATRSLDAARAQEGGGGSPSTVMAAGVRGRNTGADALFRSRRFRPARYFTEMHRDLRTDVPVTPLPTNLRLAPITPAWWDRMREAQNEIFRDHWATEPISAEQFAAHLSLPSARADLSRLAVRGAGEDARVVGLVLVETHPNRFTAAGYTSAYIDVVGVRREHRGRGIAQSLLSAALSSIRAEGLERAVLDVDTANPTGALRLYEHLGFTPADRMTVYER